MRLARWVLTRPGRMIAAVFGLTVAWDLFQIGLTKPILNRLTGERQDLSQFAGRQGNLSALLVLLALSWTLAAIGEEILCRADLRIVVAAVPRTTNMDRSPAAKGSGSLPYPMRAKSSSVASCVVRA